MINNKSRKYLYHEFGIKKSFISLRWFRTRYYCCCFWIFRYRLIYGASFHHLKSIVVFFIFILMVEQISLLLEFIIVISNLLIINNLILIFPKMNLPLKLTNLLFQIPDLPHPNFILLLPNLPLLNQLILQLFSDRSQIWNLFQIFLFMLFQLVNLHV